MGFFSWHAQDTNDPIYNKWQKHTEVFPVYMVNPKTGESYKEDAYDGYGVFGGKDFYCLLAELNKEKIGGVDWGNMDAVREAGIELAFKNSPSGENPNALFPILVEELEYWRDYIGEIPRSHDGQGYWMTDDVQEYEEEDE